MICVITGTGATPCHPSCKRNDRPVAGGLERHSADADIRPQARMSRPPSPSRRGGSGGCARRRRRRSSRSRRSCSRSRARELDALHRSEVGPRADRADRVDGHALALGHAGVGRALLGGGAARGEPLPLRLAVHGDLAEHEVAPERRRRRPRRGTARRRRRPGRAAPRRTRGTPARSESTVTTIRPIRPARPRQRRMLVRARGCATTETFRRPRRRALRLSFLLRHLSLPSRSAARRAGAR